MSSGLNSKCRTCLTETGSYHQLLDYVEESYNIIEMLDCVVPQIDFKKTSQLSSLVCQICVDKLLIAYKFQRLCIETNKRLRDILRISETKTKLPKLMNPLTVQSNLILKDYIEDGCFESEITGKFFNERTKSENDRIPDNGSESDSGSSNEKLSILKERSEQKLHLKEENIQCLDRENQCKAKDDKNQNIQDFDLISIFDDKTTGVFETESTSAVVEQIIYSECENVSDNSKDEILSKSGENKIINTDLGRTGKVEKDTGKADLSCGICGKIFYRAHRLEMHGLVHSRDRPHECKICKYRFATKSSLKAHLAQHNNDKRRSFRSSLRPEPHECPDCFRRFKTHSGLLIHGQTHKRNSSEAIYTCTLCQQSFESVRFLTEHITSKHPEAEKYNCDQCDKTFVLHAQFVQHLNRHKGSGNVVCLICEKEFGYSRLLKEHMRTHSSEHPYLCNQCGKTFRNATNLSRHVETHAVSKQYQCPECPSRFVCKPYLAKHIITHSNAKPYACDICGSRFAATTSLRKHKKFHSEERPFKCDQCGMSFALGSILRRHMITHTGEKPYKCKYCERAYAAKGDLTKHLRTHVGENTYKCDQCSMTFKYQADLRQHLAHHYKMSQLLEKEHDEK